MKYYSFRAMLLIAPIFASGCALNLSHVRDKDNSELSKEEISYVREHRALKISEQETFYTKKLVCAGEKFNSLIPESSKNKRIPVSVAPIYDKTGKVYGATNSSALSDIVLHSLSKTNIFHLIETPLGYDLMESRNNFNAEFLANNTQLFMNTTRAPIGVLFPVDFYISGALVQYDESSEFPSTNIGIDANLVKAKRNVSSITIGLQLRIIDAKAGNILYLPGVGSASVFLTNKLYKISNNANIFKIKGDSPYGIDYTVDVADPVQYAVNEIVEKALFELLNKFVAQDVESGC